MTDSRTRLLAAVARQREREGDTQRFSADSSSRRETGADLSHHETRARKQMSAARARRRLATGDEPDA